MDTPLKWIGDFGAKGGLGLLFILISLGLLTKDKIDLSDLSELGKSLATVSPMTLIIGGFILVATLLLAAEILDRQKQLDDEKKKIDAQKREFEQALEDQKSAVAILQASEAAASEEDRRALADLVGQFSSHRMFYLPIHYEDIGEVVQSVKYLRGALNSITRGKGLRLARLLADRAADLLAEFDTAVAKIQDMVEQEVSFKIKAIEDGRLDDEVRLLGEYRKFRRPAFSTENRLVVQGGTRLSLLQINELATLNFVSAFFLMRGGFREIVTQIERAGVPVPDRLKISH